MAEKWERNYADICDDAQESVSPVLTWARLFIVLREKFIPIINLPDEKLEMLRARMASRLDERRIMYLFDPGVCSFCKRATAISRSLVYGPNSRACRACILNAKCFSEAWVVRDIHKAIRSGDYALFRTLIRRGLTDIYNILNRDPDEEEIPR